MQGNFKLHVEEGNFTDSEIIVMLGENRKDHLHPHAGRHAQA